MFTPALRTGEGGLCGPGAPLFTPARRKEFALCGAALKSGGPFCAGLNEDRRTRLAHPTGAPHVRRGAYSL